MELLTVQETARLLKVAPITIRRYIANGRLPAVKVGRAVRVRKEAIEALPTPFRPKRRPTYRSRAPHIPRGRPTSADDPLWNIIGIGRSEGPTDVSANKYKYLADAYAARHPSVDEA